MNITKEEFEEVLDRKLDQKLDEKLDTKLAAHTKEIKTFVVEHVDRKIDSLAIIINRGFQNLQYQINELKPSRPWKNSQN